jgi:hypothetical protein
MSEQAITQPVAPAATQTVLQTRVRCRHIHTAGNQCGSPALRNEIFCYYHHTTRRPKAAPGGFRYLNATEPFQLPIIEDRASAHHPRRTPHLQPPGPRRISPPRAKTRIGSTSS